MSVTVDVDIQRLQDANVVRDVIADDDVEWLPIDGDQTSTRSHRLLFNLSQLKTKKNAQKTFLFYKNPSSAPWVQKTEILSRALNFSQVFQMNLIPPTPFYSILSSIWFLW